MTLEISINTNNIPPSVGEIREYQGNKSLHIESMTKFREWVLSKVPIESLDEEIIFVVSGSMPNCAALMIGLLLSGKGQVVFKTTKDFRREMVV